MKKKLPIGLDSFEKMRTNDFYYVDKTLFIKELLQNWGEVNLFTRPRRFGKSLNMSMLKSFFEVGGDPALFDGLKISWEKELCGKYQGKFPVISISLKGVDGRSFFSASTALRTIIGNEAILIGKREALQRGKRGLPAPDSNWLRGGRPLCHDRGSGRSELESPLAAPCEALRSKGHLAG